MKLQTLTILLAAAAAAAASTISYYQVPSAYWNGARTRELQLTSDIRFQDSRTQQLHCLMLLQRRQLLLGRNDCVVFYRGSASPCFIGTLKVQYYENLQLVTEATDGGVVKVWVMSLTRTNPSDAVIMQHRVSSSMDFFRNWSDYATVFGGDPSGNFWIGLESIHRLTSARQRGLYIEMTLWNGSMFWANYSSFLVGPATDNYRLLSLGTFKCSSSQLGNCMTSCLGQNFSTPDVDLDISPTSSCSQSYRGGWWYSACHSANPNGLYFVPPEALNSSTAYARGIVWSVPFGYYYSMKEFLMQIW